MHHPKRITIKHANNVKLVSKQYEETSFPAIRVVNRRIEFLTKRGVEYTIEVLGNDMDGFFLHLVRHPLGISNTSVMAGNSTVSVTVFKTTDELAQWFADRPRTVCPESVQEIMNLANDNQLYFRGRTDLKSC